MGDPATDLGQALAQQAGGQTGGNVVSLQVADPTDDGRVNLIMPDGSIMLGVACPTSYTDRQAGDWVAVRMSSVPVVLWRLGDDPGDATADQAKQIATDVAHDIQVVRAATYGTGGPSGSGWMQVTGSAGVYIRVVDGKIEQYFQVTSASGTSPGTPSVPTPRPVTVSPTSSGSWRNGHPDDYSSSPMQGDWTGGGNRRGAWFYGTKIASACSGKTVASMRVAFTRKSGSGVNAKRPLHLYLHGYTSPPSGQLSLGSGPQELLSLSAGGRGTATLPAAWRSALASGSARGLAIYCSGSHDYMAVTNGAITISFS